MAVLSALSTTLSDPAGLGLRPARPGEFSRRAFTAGKMDLAQLEGLADLVGAETEQQRRQAIRQMDGDLSREHQRWRSQLLRLVSRLEAHIDFSETDDLGDDGVVEEVALGVRQLANEMDRRLSGSRAAERLRSGVRLAVVGAPNAGKSSLLNLLSGRDAAIVSPAPGTTRDAIESALDLGGFPAVAVDTAGLRRSHDPVEAEGVARAVNNANSADLVVFVQDATEVATTELLRDHETLLKMAKERCVEFGMDQEKLDDLVLFVNKIDLLPPERRCQLEASGRVCFLSCLGGVQSCDTALSRLVEEVGLLCGSSMGSGEAGAATPQLTRARHAAHLARARDHLRECLLQHHWDLALAAEGLRRAAREVGLVAGKEVDSEQVLEEIFAEFCIGK